MYDQKLVNWIRQGKESRALDQLYDGFPAVRKLICSKGGSEEEARDVFQEALLIFCEKAAKPEFTLTAAASTYLYSVSRFLWIDRRRKSGREIAVAEMREADPDDFDLEAHMEKERRFAFVEEALERLGDRCKQMLEGFYLRKQSMQELASQFGFSSERSAKTQKYKCIERARKMAREEYEVLN